MSTQIRLFLLGVWLSAGAVSPLRAQIVNDGATNTLSHVTNAFTGDVTIGTNGAFSLLVLSNQALLTNSADGVISRNVAARSNEVRLLGPGTRWLAGSNLLVGKSGSFSRLVVSDGALMQNPAGEIGNSGSTNLVLVTGPGSAWTNASDLLIGRSGSGNSLIVSNGGVVRSGRGLFAISSSTSNNSAVVTGPGSIWDSGHISLGEDGRGNRLVVSDGGVVQDSSGYLGAGSVGRDNVAIMTGPGTKWNHGNECSVGHQGPGTLLVVSNGAAMLVNNFLRVGAHPTSLSNRMVIEGGTLQVTNTFSLEVGVLDVIRGRVVLNAGLIEANHLRMTNAQGFFEFNGGTLSVRNSTLASGQMFRVGDGVSPATFNLAGNGQHKFTSLTVQIASNASFTGSGTIDNTVVQFAVGSRLAPGNSIGKMSFTRSPTLQGATFLELSKTGPTLTNDQIQVSGPLTYGGSLAVSHLGPAALASGDRFQLFVADSYTGSFSSLTLPALGPGLAWNNQLLTDGSIEVVSELVTVTNTTVRVMAANLTSGNNQRYETPGLNILRALHPDIVAIQEFNVSNAFGLNTPEALNSMVATTFGAEYQFFRESGYAIPNGIISRYPILASGSWEDIDTGINDRGFAWALIDLPGTNDLYVVSVHLKASSGSANEIRRAAQAAELKDLITTNFPANAWVIVAGDMNLFSDTEQAIETFKTFLSDSPLPTDQNGDPDTNAGRVSRYDRVLPSFAMTNAIVPLVMPSRIYTNGLVFDSRVYTPLPEVAPVQLNDSGAANMQHMAVLKAFNVAYTVTNVLVVAPTLSIARTGPAQITVSWAPSIPGFVLQQASSLSAASWHNAPSGATNPITLPASGPMQCLRLFKP